MKTPLSSIVLVLFGSFVGSFGAAGHWHYYLSAVLCVLHDGRSARATHGVVSDGFDRLYLGDCLGTTVFQGALYAI